MKRRGMSLALCAAMAMGTIGVVPAMADDVTTITYWVNDRHDSEYMTEMVYDFSCLHRRYSTGYHRTERNIKEFRR